MNETMGWVVILVWTYLAVGMFASAGKAGSDNAIGYLVLWPLLIVKQIKQAWREIWEGWV